MWTITSLDIAGLRGGGGQPFTAFVDALLRAQCFVSGVPDSAITTTLTVNVSDGGVDTTINQGASADGTGYLSLPSAWQYKAVSADRLTEGAVTQEINKPYAAELVSRGFGYRLCAAVDVSPTKKDRLVRALNRAAQAINPAAVPCHLLTASDLAAWANRFPALVATLFERPTTLARHGQAWLPSQTAVTREYVSPPGGADRIRAIQKHLDFSQAPMDPVLPVIGAAGVGKSRIVFEAIRAIPGALFLVAITNDDRRAQEAAQWLVNSPSIVAILVVDECSIQARFELNGLVRGHESRLRVVAIDNTGEPPPEGAPGIWVEKVDPKTVEEILRRNFPVVPPERRRAYADLSGGYIRLAADLSRHDFQMHTAGSLQPAIPSLQEYYQRRLVPEDRKVVEAIALLHRVGHSGDVESQLLLLADLTGTTPELIRDAAARLKDAPGFVVLTPRYYYVTPQIIAEIAFQRAWQRLAEVNPAAFLDRLPEPIRAAFELRIRGLADQGVRSIVSAHFRNRASGLTPADLADSAKVEPFLGLLDTDPGTYLPQLTRLVREATPDELLAINGTESGNRGTRRELVWAAERLAIFPEHFESAELVLRRLALAETEHGIGNNATGIWRQLFRVYLSGTNVPFGERFDLFEEQLMSAAPEERDLALGGLDHLLDTNVTRMGTPSVVGGRIPPADWYPKTSKEFEDCFSRVIERVEDLLTRLEPLASAGWTYLSRHVQRFLAWHRLDQLQGIVDRHPLPEVVLGPWLEQIDDFLQYERGNPATATLEFEDYCRRVRDWQAKLLPGTFGGRLRGILGKDLWHHSVREDIHKQASEIAPLVDEVLASPELLVDNLDYLGTPEARSTSTFGILLGRKDLSGAFLDRILSSARQNRNTALLRGYVGGLLDTSNQIPRVLHILDTLEQEDPPIAADVIVGGLSATDPATRLVRMVGSGKLAVGYLQYLHYGGLIQKIPSDQFAAALKAAAPPGSPSEALKIAVELIGDRLPTRDLQGEHPETFAIIKDVLERSASVDDQAAYWWRTALERLSAIEPSWAATAATSAISGDDFHKRNDAISVLRSLAANGSGDAVMDAVGRALLDPNRGWRWLVGSHREIFEALPTEVVMNWLHTVGLEGARRLARHLPSPTLTVDGTPSVPDLTERVLTEYGDDTKVFGEFFTGRHDLEASWGSVASHHQGHVEVAEAFLNHPNMVIRAWAERERASAQEMADFWRKHEEDEEWT